MRIICWFVFVFCSFSMRAETYVLSMENPLTTASDMGMGNRKCLYEWPTTKVLEFSVRMPYELKALSTKHLTVGMEAFLLYWNIGLGQTGNSYLNELSAFLSLRKQLNERIRLGVQLTLLTTYSVAASTGRLLYATLDCQWEMSPKTTVSMLLINPNCSKMRVSEHWLTTTNAFFTGLEYALSPTFCASTEIGFQLREKPSWSIGTSYRIREQLSIQSGLVLLPACPTWGLNAWKGRWKWMYSGSWHPILGISSQLSAALSW